MTASLHCQIIDYLNLIDFMVYTTTILSLLYTCDTSIIRKRHLTDLFRAFSRRVMTRTDFFHAFRRCVMTCTDFFRAFHRRVMACTLYTNNSIYFFEEKRRPERPPVTMCRFFSANVHDLFTAQDFHCAHSFLCMIFLRLLCVIFHHWVIVYSLICSWQYN